MNKNAVTNALLVFAVLALTIFAIGIVSPETYADWKSLTFHEPAHYLFEFQNEAIVAAIVIPLWQRAKAKAVRQAIVEHDAKHHPHSHAGVDKGAEV